MQSQGKLRGEMRSLLAPVVTEHFPKRKLNDVLSVTNVADFRTTPVYIVVFDVDDGGGYGVVRVAGNEVELITKDMFEA